MPGLVQQIYKLGSRSEQKNNLSWSKCLQRVKIMAESQIKSNKSNIVFQQWCRSPGWFQSIDIDNREIAESIAS